MGSGHRMAVVAAASHVRNANHTQPQVTYEGPHYNVNALFVSATLCGVLVAVCAACCRRATPHHKPVAAEECRGGVYTVSADLPQRVTHIPDDMTGPPPAYDSVVIDGPIPVGPPVPKDSDLQEVVTECCHRHTERCNSGLPTYEMAVLLRDTKL